MSAQIGTPACCFSREHPLPLLHTDDLDHFDAISIRLDITGTAAHRFHVLLEWAQQQLDDDPTQATVVLPVLSDQAKTLAGWLGKCHQRDHALWQLLSQGAAILLAYSSKKGKLGEIAPLKLPHPQCKVIRCYNEAAMTRITIRDELTFRIGKAPQEFMLGIPPECTTVRELIRARVYHEVANYNAHQPGSFHRLVQPPATMLRPEGLSIDSEQQFLKAVEAFERNGFLILVDDQQVTGLDDQIAIRPETVVTFLKLVPLVGG